MMAQEENETYCKKAKFHNSKRNSTVVIGIQDCTVQYCTSSYSIQYSTPCHYSGTIARACVCACVRACVRACCIQTEVLYCTVLYDRTVLWYSSTLHCTIEVEYWYCRCRVARGVQYCTVHHKNS